MNYFHSDGYGASLILKFDCPATRCGPSKKAFDYGRVKFISRHYFVENVVSTLHCYPLSLIFSAVQALFFLLKTLFFFEVRGNSCCRELQTTKPVFPQNEVSTICLYHLSNFSKFLEFPRIFKNVI